MSDKDFINKITQIEHDDSLGIKKAIVYGWDGSKAVIIKVNSDGSLLITT